LLGQLDSHFSPKYSLQVVAAATPGVIYDEIVPDITDLLNPWSADDRHAFDEMDRWLT
jgi:hypothetical protein